MTVLIAIIGVLGPAIVAYISVMSRSKKTERELLSQELDLLKKMRPGTQTYEDLEHIIADRVAQWRVAVDSYFGVFFLTFTIVTLCAAIALRTTNALYTRVDSFNRLLHQGTVLALILAGVSIAFAAIIGVRERAENRRKHAVIVLAIERAAQAQNAYEVALAAGDSVGAQKALQARTAALLSLTPGQRDAALHLLSLPS